MTETVVVEWDGISLSELIEMEESEYQFLYALVRGNNLLYIGMAYRSSIVDAVKEKIRELEQDPKGLTIWIGEVNPDETTYGRITEQIIDDVKCLLIYTHQPSLNVLCTKSYTGRDGLKVKNRGRPYLKPCVRAEEGKVYKTC